MSLEISERCGLCCGGPLDGTTQSWPADTTYFSVPLLRKDCSVANYLWNEPARVWVWNGPNDEFPRKQICDI